MNNIEKFRKLFLEFEVATRKKVGNDRLNLDECIKELKSKRINPYIRDDNFIDFCRRLRNINSHNINDNYYLITDETITKLEKIVEEVKHPYKVSNKATLNIYSKTLNDNVMNTMKDMNEKSYTHIPIYDETNKHLVGIFSESSLFQYILEDKIIEVDENTKFNDIKNEHIAIHFDTQTQLEKLIDYLKIYEYNYGTGRYSSLDEIKDLTVNYFGKSNQYISLDRCKQQVPFNYCSCGKGYQDIIYEFDDIDWGI